MNNFCKLRVKKRFNRASLTYDQVATVQLDSAKVLVDFLYNNYLENQQNKMNNILDLGAGTGFITEALLKYFPSANYILSDFARHMLDIAQTKLPNSSQFKFVVEDLDEQNFSNQDLVISNLSLQWSKDLKKILNKLNRDTKYIAFTSLTSGTFSVWQEAIRNLGINFTNFAYPTKQDLDNLLNSFDYDSYISFEKEYSLTFSNALEFMSYLQNLGAQEAGGILSYSQAKEIINSYQRPFTITYNIYFVIIKNV